ncbi:2752_t:CDS:2, partial [Gigaspora rosea]
ELLNTTTQENSKSCESTSAMIVEQNSRSGLIPKIPSMMSETITEINNTQIRIDLIQQDREADEIGRKRKELPSS